MAANINYNEASKEYSFFSRKEVAWHNLGQVIQEAVNAEEALKISHLDYEVGLAPIWASFIPKNCSCPTDKTDQGYPIYNFNKTFTGEFIAKKGERVQGQFATYRKDTMEVFGLVGSKYEVVQNSAALDFIYSIIKDNSSIKDRRDIIIETAGALGAGETMFVTAKLPGYMRINGSDDVTEKYLVFTSGHAGNESVSALVTNIRVVCANTLNAAIKGCQNIVRFKHTKNIEEAMRQGASLLRLTNEYNEDLQLALNVMAKKQLTVTEVQNYIYGIFTTPTQFDLIKYNGSINNVSEKDISTRLRNKIGDVKSFMEAGVGQDLFRGTAYWAYNGITSYLNNGLEYKTQEDKFQSVIKGSSAKINQTAFDLALTLV